MKTKNLYVYIVARNIFYSFLISILVIIFFSSVLIAQENSSSPATIEQPAKEAADSRNLMLEEIKAKRAEAERSTDLSESDKKNVLAFLDKALVFLEQANRFDREANEIDQIVQTSQERLQHIQSELNRPVLDIEKLRLEIASMDAEQLEQRLNLANAELAGADDSLQSIQKKLNDLRSGPQQLNEKIAESKKQFNIIQEELSTFLPSDKTLSITEAKRASLLAEIDKIRAEIKLYEKQAGGNSVLISLATAKRDLAIHKEAAYSEVVGIVGEHLHNAYQREASEVKEAVEAAKEKATSLPPAIRHELDLNLNLGRELEELTLEHTDVKKEIESLQAQITALDEEFSLARETVAIEVHSEVIGLALRSQRQSLPSLPNYRRKSSQRRLKMTTVRQKILTIDRQRRDFVELDDNIKGIIKSLKIEPTSALEKSIKEALQDRRDLLEKLQAGYQRYFKDLQKLDFNEQQLVTKADEFGEFLAAHLLWVRSSRILGFEDLRNLPSALAWLAGPGNWFRLPGDIWESFKSKIIQWLFGIAAVVLLMSGRTWAAAAMESIDKRVGRIQKDSFLLTFKALLLTLVKVSAFPALMLMLGYQLVTFPGARTFTLAVGGGLTAAAWLLLKTRFLCDLCGRSGVGTIHFKWPREIRQTLLDNFRWWIPLTVPMEFVLNTIGKQPKNQYVDSLGRLVFIAVMIANVVFLFRILRPSGEIGLFFNKRRQQGWFARMGYVWYLLAMGLSIGIAVFAVTGYYYAASAFWYKVVQTLTFAVCLILVNGLFLRWLSITRKHISIEETKRKKKETLEKPGDQFEVEQVAEKLPQGGEPELDWDQIDEQTRSLIRNIMFFVTIFGLWIIWVRDFQALTIIDQIHLWNYHVEIEGVTKVLPITMADLIMAVAVTAITIFVYRDMPAAMELILKRLSLDAGARYAIVAVCRYTVMVVGIIVALKTIGFSLSRLQWLVAGLGVGLGFGLQEIVANFIAGLIIFIERPFRFGDYVSVGDLDGTVTRIRIRATTITDWDRRELIVPNKEFITSRLINWTLSDPLTRLKIPVGIAYGSDTSLAKNLLLKIAHDHPAVMNDPQPAAYFLGFGDNSLNFELRIFVNKIDIRVSVTDELHMAIDEEFKKAGISIAFPQRDVHLDKIGPIEVKVIPEEKTAKPVRKARKD